MHDKEFTKGMRGEFRGDFTRDTFDPYKRFSRVLMQQGRVQLDADWNEQVSILLYQLRAMGTHLMGPHGYPCTADGAKGPDFSISADGADFSIAPGSYYVDGILCENSEAVSYRKQPDLPMDVGASLAVGEHLVYLDVWERHISFVEDDYIREKALTGPDTAARAKIVWQVKTVPIEEGDADADFKRNHERFLNKLNPGARPGSGELRARARRAPPASEPCLISPEASYRGPENQLYRVEIHHGGDATSANGITTFKWSRENGAVVFPVTEINGEKISLEHLGRDARFTLSPNDWVEVLDDHTILKDQAGTLLQVKEVDTENLQVTLSGVPPVTVGGGADNHPYLRRWDHKTGGEYGIDVEQGDTDQSWILLEDGVEIQFPPPQPDAAGNVTAHLYQTGDYWLIPARTATGDVEWPGPVEAPEALPPQGVKHHYAPLWRITVETSGDVVVVAAGDQRRKLKKLWD